LINIAHLSTQRSRSGFRAFRHDNQSPSQPRKLFSDASRWQAHATFIGDDSGCFAVAHQAPISGTYDGISSIGLVWSAERLPGEAQPVPAGSIMRPFPVDLEAVSPEGRREKATFERRVAGPGVIRHPIRSEGIVGTLFLPPGAGPHPGVLVVSGGGGGIDEFRGPILASHGYAALALGYFGVEGLPRGLVNIPLEYVENALAWMRRQLWLRDELLAVWGASRGGELALLLGATFAEINAVIAWVPSGVIFWALGLPEPGDTRPRAAWTFRGKPLPYLQENNSSHGPEPEAVPGEPVAYTPFYRSFLRDAQAVERAAIPVEKIRGPVLLVSGTDDQTWPSPELAGIVLRRLEAHHHSFPFRHIEYPGAGHLILVPYWPLTVRAVSRRRSSETETTAAPLTSIRLSRFHPTLLIENRDYAAQRYIEGSSEAKRKVIDLI
jgi:pimeloyl-ACP methyl ester carboxylesterase